MIYQIAGVRIRRMAQADVGAVMEIAESLPEAPHWPAAAYQAALDAEGMPWRVALVATVVVGDDQEHLSGAKQAERERLISNEGPRSRPSGAKAKHGVGQPTYGLKPLPITATTSFSALAGFAVACLVQPQAELEMIAVAGAAQRQGVAGRLFAALAEELHGTGITEVVLEVRASNLPALGLYRRLGFQETGLRRSYYADPVEDAVLMSLQIGRLAGGPD